jgi:hypothetical protein
MRDLDLQVLISLADLFYLRCAAHDFIEQNPENPNVPEVRKAVIRAIQIQKEREYPSRQKGKIT